MARRRKRRYKPRFFVICGSLICLIVSLVLIIFVGSKFEVNYETLLEDVKKYPTIRGSSVNTTDQICRWIHKRLEACDAWIEAL